MNKPLDTRVELFERTNGSGYILIWYRHQPITRKQSGHEFHETLESAQASIAEVMQYVEKRN